MADEVAVMFAGGKPTPVLLARWRAKGGAVQPQATVAYLEADRSATPVLRSLWRMAFPDRRTLPFGPIVGADGRFTSEMLNIWN